MASQLSAASMIPSDHSSVAAMQVFTRHRPEDRVANFTKEALSGNHWGRSSTKPVQVSEKFAGCGYPRRCRTLDKEVFEEEAAGYLARRAVEDCPRRRQNFSVATRSRTNVPASISATAMRIAATAVWASKRVTLCSSFLPPMTFTGLPSARRMLARHLPGSCSNARTTNRLYSMSGTTEMFDGIQMKHQDGPLQ